MDKGLHFSSETLKQVYLCGLLTLTHCKYASLPGASGPTPYIFMPLRSSPRQQLQYRLSHLSKRFKLILIVTWEPATGTLIDLTFSCAF